MTGASGARLRVMTWNLWWRFGPWEQRLPAIAHVLAEQDADVVMLQECWRSGHDSLAERLATVTGHHCVESDDPFPSRQVGFHNALLSRWPLSNVASVALPDAAGMPGHRRLLMADAATPWGAWPLACTHLDHRFDESALRQRQVAAITDLLAARRHGPSEQALPPLLGADLNAVPDSDEVGMLTGRRAAPTPGLVMSDCWEHAGDGPGHTWRADNPYRVDTAWPNRRLDYVMVAWPRPKPVGNPQRAWLAGVDAVQVNGTEVWASDHAAVVVDLRTPTPAQSRG
jgi:endonuclease/exonuclease/phosphatase family metal-dependent hydrolase